MGITKEKRLSTICKIDPKVRIRRFERRVLEGYYVGKANNLTPAGGAHAYAHSCMVSLRANPRLSGTKKEDYVRNLRAWLSATLKAIGDKALARP